MLLSDSYYPGVDSDPVPSLGVRGPLWMRVPKKMHMNRNGA